MAASVMTGQNKAIQGFASFCGCNTQTLRYYDRIGLLATEFVLASLASMRYNDHGAGIQFLNIQLYIH